MTEVSVGELFVRLIVSLGVVIGIMAAVAWGLRRMGNGTLGRARTGRPVRVEIIARQSLGRRSSIALVRAGGRGLVLGVTDQHVTLLAEADPDEFIIDEPPRTAAQTGDPMVPGSAWRNMTEALRERTVRRS